MKTIKTIAFLTALFAASAANAAIPAQPVFSEITPVPAAGSVFSLAGANGELTLKYWGVQNASDVWFSNNVNGSISQSPAPLGTFIGNLTSKSLNQAENVDSLGGGESASFTNTALYSILAVHFGKHELIFDFGQQIALGTTFNISIAGKAAGLSNFRTYLDSDALAAPSSVPVPAAIWLFGSGLVGLIGYSRRRGQRAI